MTMTMPATSAANSYKLERYREALEKIPPPGSGSHTALLSATNYGVLASVPPDDIFNDIRRKMEN